MATYYVSQSGAGTQDGSSAANARPVSWLNTSGNWGGSGIVAGDTVRLVGTISSQFEVFGSGTAGNVITILFEPGAKLSTAAPPNGNGFIRLVNRSYITIDGMATGLIGGIEGSPTNANGIIEYTDNGTHLTTQLNGSGIVCMQGQHITIQNLYIRNIYVREADAPDGTAGGSNCIMLLQETARPQFALTVYNCLLHDAQTGVNTDYGNDCHSFLLDHVTAYRCNWGGRSGSRNDSSYLIDITVQNCHFYDWTNWDTQPPPVDHFHHNGFFIWCHNGRIEQVTMRNNVVGPNYTNSLGGYNASTSGFFVINRIDLINIYNNVFLHNVGGGPSNGQVVVSSSVGGTVNIFNNTFVGGSSTTNINFNGAAPFNIKNNLMIGLADSLVNLYNTGSVVDSDHNLGFNLLANPFKWGSGGSGGGISLASWQAIGPGHDPDWLTADPLLTETYRLGEGSPAIGTGENLTAYFTTDAAGVTRPALGNWDIGAYQYGAAPPAAGNRGRKNKGVRLLVML